MDDAYADRSLQIFEGGLSVLGTLSHDSLAAGRVSGVSPVPIASVSQSNYFPASAPSARLSMLAGEDDKTR